MSEDHVRVSRARAVHGGACFLVSLSDHAEGKIKMAVQFHLCQSTKNVSFLGPGGFVTCSRRDCLQ
ncbi:hypothetical protein BaRGS_00002742, partial [Batillaria attramentaria]